MPTCNRDSGAPDWQSTSYVAPARGYRRKIPRRTISSDLFANNKLADRDD